jgi:hypothetical protein
MYIPSRSILTCHIAGFSHWEGDKAFKKLEPGTSLSMKAESDNPFDPSAVALYCQDFKLGYIPADKNDLISRFMFFGYEDAFEARIIHVDMTAHLERQIQVTICIKDAQKIPPAREV